MISAQVSTKWAKTLACTVLKLTFFSAERKNSKKRIVGRKR
nr:MAG TPA: hypothetical protein [Caudoviricetes sp.]